MRAAMAMTPRGAKPVTPTHALRFHPRADREAEAPNVDGCDAVGAGRKAMPFAGRDRGDLAVGPLGAGELDAARATPRRASDRRPRSRAARPRAHRPRPTTRTCRTSWPPHQRPKQHGSALRLPSPVAGSPRTTAGAPWARPPRRRAPEPAPRWRPRRPLAPPAPPPSGDRAIVGADLVGLPLSENSPAAPAPEPVRRPRSPPHRTDAVSGAHWAKHQDRPGFVAKIAHPTAASMDATRMFWQPRGPCWVHRWPRNMLAPTPVARPPRGRVPRATCAVPLRSRSPSHGDPLDPMHRRSVRPRSSMVRGRLKGRPVGEGRVAIPYEVAPILRPPRSFSGRRRGQAALSLACGCGRSLRRRGSSGCTSRSWRLHAAGAGRSTLRAGARSRRSALIRRMNTFALLGQSEEKKTRSSRARTSTSESFHQVAGQARRRPTGGAKTTSPRPTRPEATRSAGSGRHAASARRSFPQALAASGRWASRGRIRRFGRRSGNP